MKKQIYQDWAGGKSKYMTVTIELKGGSRRKPESTNVVNVQPRVVFGRSAKMSSKNLKPVGGTSAALPTELEIQLMAIAKEIAEIPGVAPEMNTTAFLKLLRDEFAALWAEHYKKLLE